MIFANFATTTEPDNSNIQPQLYLLHLPFQFLDGLQKLLLAEAVFALLGHFRADVMHEFPHLFNIGGGQIVRLIQRVERTEREFALVLDFVVHDFEDDAVVLREHDVRLAAADVGPVEDVLARDEGTVGDGQHRVAADLEGAVFAVAREEGHRERRQHLDIFGVGEARGVARLGFFAHEFDVLVVVVIDRGGQNAQIAAFQVNVVAALQLRKLARADATQIDFHQSIDGNAKIFREGDQGLKVRFGHAVFIAAQRGAFHIQGKSDIVLRAVAVLAEEFDVRVEVHDIVGFKI